MKPVMLIDRCKFRWQLVPYHINRYKRLHAWPTLHSVRYNADDKMQCTHFHFLSFCKDVDVKVMFGNNFVLHCVQKKNIHFYFLA